ncbi:Uncharacterised protein [BD1-7 clade bacterium]|uniref:Uncharacterized protein n=1 Tax=BD1-7 clade bacterium TaxID=2029982 RepID=A0A5S9PID1_9GAMM|nr:Uncharacterised protein [BD1-7 clade bacterium]CAA0103768.1 Uncharacterised protein [BD1-7 clade bacterium]
MQKVGGIIKKQDRFYDFFDPAFSEYKCRVNGGGTNPPRSKSNITLVAVRSLFNGARVSALKNTRQHQWGDQ